MTTRQQPSALLALFDRLASLGRSARPVEVKSNQNQVISDERKK